MFKKIICLLAVLMVIFTFSVSAKDDLMVYGQDDIEGICKALDMDAGEIRHYCEQNNVKYLAVNPGNTKLVKRTEIIDDFSKRIVDLSVLSDENIQTLAYEISHFSDATGEIIKREGYKILKYELKSEDNKFYLTTFMTVKNSSRVTLSFYTDVDTDRDYIDDIVSEQFKGETNYKPFIIAGVAIFSLLAVAIVILIIKDLRKKD